ncbi:MAG: VWA domain-containing protein, partial [Pseudomonadota bacterium]
KSETSIIIVVDASGSTAINRLGEAKGAIEMLLGEGYARRDHVALIAMRGKQAEVLLPPTRSLVRAKRCLSNLVGGGGTPLAHGLQLADNLSREEEKKGRSVSLVVLTDGSANIALDQTAGRQRANEDALAAAGKLAEARVSALIIDVSKLPSSQARELATKADGNYLPMPFASAQNISSAASAGLSAM